MSLRHRVEVLERGPTGDGRVFTAADFAERLKAGIEAHRRGERCAWFDGEGPDLDLDDFTHSVDRRIAKQLNAMRRRMQQQEEG